VENCLSYQQLQKAQRMDDMMNDMEEPLEKLLKQALKQTHSPSGLEQKIMARVKAAPPKTKHWQRAWLAIAASLAVLSTGYLAYMRYQAEKSKEQLILALQITSQTLNKAFEIAFQETNEKIKQMSQEETK